MRFIDYFRVHNNVRAIDALKACIGQCRWSNLCFCDLFVIPYGERLKNLKKDTHPNINENTR